MPFLHVFVGARQQQNIIRNARGRAPHFLAVEDPAARGPFGHGLHGAEHIRAAAGFREPDRDAALAGGDQGQEFPLLLRRSVYADGLAARERGQSF